MEEIIFLLLTILFELPLALGGLKKTKKSSVILAVISVNLLTHPMAWFMVTQGSSWMSMEAIVTVIEAAVFALCFPRQLKQALLIAILMNLFSALAGRILF